MGLFKSISRAVKKVTKPISKIGGKIGDEFDKVADNAGPEIGAVIGFMVGGPAGAAIGSGIGSLAGGRSIEESLRNAALAGGITYAGSAAFNSMAGAGAGTAGTAGASGSSNLAAAAAKTGQLGPTVANANVAQGLTASGALPNSLAANVGAGAGTGAVSTGAANAGLMSKLGSGLGALKEASALDILGYGSLATSALGAAGMFGGPEEVAMNLPPETRAGMSFAQGYRDGRSFDLGDDTERQEYIESIAEAIREKEEEDNEIQFQGIATAADGMYKNLDDDFFMNNPQPPTSGGMLVGPGSGKSDSIMAGIYDNMGNYEGPARLSDGEFVVTADAIKGLGDGDPQIGAARMYEMMASMERMA